MLRFLFNIHLCGSVLTSQGHDLRIRILEYGILRSSDQCPHARVDYHHLNLLRISPSCSPCHKRDYELKFTCLGFCFENWDSLVLCVLKHRVTRLTIIPKRLSVSWATFMWVERAHIMRYIPIECLQRSPVSFRVFMNLRNISMCQRTAEKERYWATSLQLHIHTLIVWQDQ